MRVMMGSMRRGRLIIVRVIGVGREMGVGGAMRSPVIVSSRIGMKLVVRRSSPARTSHRQAKISNHHCPRRIISTN